MSKRLRLNREEITYSDAKEREVNVLHRLGYHEQRNQFLLQLESNRPWIQSVVVHHLNPTSADACRVSETEEWIHGSFNVCIPVTLENERRTGRRAQRMMFRIPLPHRVGEGYYPGNADEKIRCEAGTYSWLQENCPDVPIPHLYGFALSTGEAVRDITILFSNSFTDEVLCIVYSPRTFTVVYPFSPVDTSPSTLMVRIPAPFILLPS